MIPELNAEMTRRAEHTGHLFGNPAPLNSTWTAPDASEISQPLDVSLWIVQRDERYGVHWYETCVRVSPP